MLLKNNIFLLHNYFFQHYSNCFDIIAFLWNSMSLILCAYCEKWLHQIAKEPGSGNKNPRIPVLRWILKGSRQEVTNGCCAMYLEAGRGALPLSFDARGQFMAWIYKLEMEFFFRCSSWWNLLRPPPAASLDLCPALLVVWALGPMIANDSLPCPWSHFNLLLGHGQDAELSLWAMHINLAGNSVLKKNFKKGSKPSPKYIPASGSKMLWAVTPGKS